MAASLQDRIEAAFERFGHRVVRNRWAAAGASLAVAASLISQLPPAFDTAFEHFLLEDDPARIVYEEFQEQFGRPDLVMVAVRPPDVFDRDFLEKLRDLHDALENEVPHIDEVSSLLNARSTRGEEDELIVEDLLEELPETAEELAALRERVLSNPFYRNTLVSEDGRFTALLVTLSLYQSDEGQDELGGFDDEAPDEDSLGDLGGGHQPMPLTGFQVGAAVDSVAEIVARHDGPDFEIAIAGSPVLQQEIIRGLQRDLTRFVAAMIGAVAVLLFLLFRRASGVLLPLLAVVLALASTIGSMAATGAPIMPPTQVLPTFLLAVGIGTAVHVLKIFYAHFDAGESVEDAVAHAMGHSGFAIVMTGVTTAAGLLSFLAAGMTPLQHLGVFAPLGVLLAQLYCLVLLPALLAIVPLRRRPPLPPSAVSGRLSRAIVRVGDFSARNPWRMVLATLALVAVAIPGILRLDFSNNVMAWLARDNVLRQSTDLIDHELKGSMTLEVVIDTGRENGIKEPALLKSLDELRLEVQEVRRGDYLFVGRTISLADVVKEIHQALNENRPEYYVIPDDGNLVSQELLLFENTGTDDLEDLVDTQFSRARFTLKVPYTDPILYDGFIGEVEAIFRDALPAETAIATTGFMGMMGQTILRVIHGLARSYTLALVIITPLMMVLLGSLRTGLASMIPNLSPIAITLGLMGWMGIDIDMFTMMIGSIAIGLVVDDTIHFMHGFRRYYSKRVATSGEETGDDDARLAIRQTLESTGQALLFTSIVLALGFSVFVLSEMRNLFYFGAFTAFAIVAAFLLDILVSPALVVLVTRHQKGRAAKAR
jgi:predicted RND superfamily exporter protein